VSRRVFRFLFGLVGLSLAACHSDLLHPLGSVAAQQRDLVIASTWLMLIIIVPVMALTVIFACIYRASNRDARYEPDWDHSILLELVIWAIPLLIIICLGAMTWLGTHLLDPYRALAQDQREGTNAVAATPAEPEPASDERGRDRPLVVEVIALDWKWLFIYPQYDIATVNELVTPVGREVEFHITASTVMNSFYVPTLAGQIYAMPAMQTTLHAIANHAGTSQGFSANYSGAGFSGMHFGYRAVKSAEFSAWVDKARHASAALMRPDYQELERPSENDRVRYFSRVDSGLFDAVVNRCVANGPACQSMSSMETEKK
jgi:cytochrome o ubiquinol oxidase subunit 2